MDTSTQLRQMRNYLVQTLEQTGEFSRIEPEYDFKSVNDNPALREQAQRHIYAVLKPEFSPNGKPLQFLVVANADTMPGPLFARKLAAASNAGIYTTHVLYRYINTLEKPLTQGPLFRRFLHQEDRKKHASYHQRSAARKNSLSHYDPKKRDNFRHLRDIEKDWIPITQGGSVLYYQPPSAELPETLKRYRWGEVIFKGSDGQGGYSEEVSRDIKEPIEIEELSSFMLCPAVRIDPHQARKKLEEIIDEVSESDGRKKIKFRFEASFQGNLLLADMVKYKSAVDNVSWEEAEEAGLADTKLR